jgi:hypothetical protein
MPPKRRPNKPKRRWHPLWIAAAAALVLATAAVAATVSISGSTASATWLGLTQPKVTAAPAMNDPTMTLGTVPYNFVWTTVPGATAYRIWLDGAPISVVRAEPGTAEGRLMAVSCGVQHRWNIQGINGQSVGPIAAAPKYFTADACP